MAYINFSACSTELSFSLSEVKLLWGNHTHTVTKQQQQSCTRPQRPVPESLINMNPSLRLGPNNSTKTNAEIYCTSSLLITMQFRHSIPQSLYHGWKETDLN